MAENDVPSVVETLVKGGECWMQISIDRVPKGLKVYVKADPRVEEFIVSVSYATPVVLETYGRNWFGHDPLNPLKIYSIEKEVPNTGYVLNNVCGPLIDRNGNANLSFLQFVGVSAPEGIKFMISGPFEAGYVKGLSAKVLTSARMLFKAYIVPMHLNLRISSTEV